ncbi:MAG: S8 family serine peptidase [bacterium]|nr:S8 family serine peptidase [bacterium]
MAESKISWEWIRWEGQKVRVVSTHVLAVLKPGFTRTLARGGVGAARAFFSQIREIPGVSRNEDDWKPRRTWRRALADPGDPGALNPLNRVRALRLLVVPIDRARGVGTIAKAGIALARFKQVQTVLPDIVHLGGAHHPADYDPGDQWHFERTNVSSGWDIETAENPDPLGEWGAETHLFVLDSGLPLDISGDKIHPDLSSDRHIKGWNFVADDDFPNDDVTAPTAGHGTAVAGLIGAETDTVTVAGDPIGRAGINWGSKVTHHKVFDSDLIGSTSLFYDACVESMDAVPLGDHFIINYSGYGPADYASYWITLCVGWEGGLLVACTGNYDAAVQSTWMYATLDSIDRMGYPAGFSARFSHRNTVIGVGAINQNDAVLDYSRRGRGVTLVAPGDNILAAQAESVGTYDWYTKFQGTSFAAPQVTGTASLIWTYRDQLTAADVRRLLVSCAYPYLDDSQAATGSVYSKRQAYGRGRVDARRSLQRAEFYEPGSAWSSLPIPPPSPWY